MMFICGLAIWAPLGRTTVDQVFPFTRTGKEPKNLPWGLNYKILHKFFFHTNYIPSRMPLLFENVGIIAQWYRISFSYLCDSVHG